MWVREAGRAVGIFRRLSRALSTVSLAAMSTLTEIESAVASLPVSQQELLLRWLAGKLHGRPTGPASLIVENGSPVLVAPPGAPEMTTDQVKAALTDFP